jgi:hypothetical protein
MDDFEDFYHDHLERDCDEGYEPEDGYEPDEDYEPSYPDPDSEYENRYDLGDY